VRQWKAERADLAVESVSRLETGRLKNITVDVGERLAAALWRLGLIRYGVAG
jgi:hypothetical protein